MWQPLKIHHNVKSRERHDEERPKLRFGTEIRVWSVRDGEWLAEREQRIERYAQMVDMGRSIGGAR